MLLKRTLVFFASLCMLGCSNDQNEIRGVLKQYFPALHGQKYEEAYRFASEKDRQYWNLSKYVTNMQEGMSPLSALFASKMEIRIDSIAVKGRSARVFISSTQPDIQKMMADFMGESLVLQRKLI